MPLLCLDNLSMLWRATNFGKNRCLIYFNRWKETSRGSLIMSATTAPRKLGLCLPDLASRLDWGVSFQLHELDDEGNWAPYSYVQHYVGFKLPVDVGRFC